MNGEQIAEAACSLCVAAEGSTWTGPDIYDALDARWPGFLTGGRRRRQAILQLHARSPIDLRPFTRRTHARIAKGLAVFASAELLLEELIGGHSASAERALNLLCADRSAGADSWGYPWDMQTRWSHYTKDTPNIVVTTFAARALAEGARVLGRDDYASRAAGAARWVQDRLFDNALGVYVYHPGSSAVIHNATMLGARAAWALRDDHPAVRRSVARAVERTLKAQRSDGSFPYGEGQSLEFVDSFHTAYVLECLCELTEVDPSVKPALEEGIAYYTEQFFDPDGRALLWPSRAYPEDAHSAGTALTTLARLHRAGYVGPEVIARVASRAASKMVLGSHAIHRRYRWGRTRVVYIRWADSHMALGLANAASSLREASP